MNKNYSSVYMCLYMSVLKMSINLCVFVIALLYISFMSYIICKDLYIYIYIFMVLRPLMG